MAELTQTKDEAFLERLYDRFADRAYARRIMQTGSILLETHDATFGHLLSVGALGPTDEVLYAELSAEMSDPRKLYRGQYVAMLRRMALSFLGDRASSVEHIPVCILPSEELNAFAIATPSGNSAIALNYALVWQMSLVFQCSAAFITWHDVSAYCRDAPQAAYGQALVGLASFVNSGDFAKLRQHKEALTFRSVDPYAEPAVTMTLMMLMFILLHEYGHVVNGHLDLNSTSPALHGTTKGVASYNKSERQELEADAFAVDQLLRRADGTTLRATDVAFTVGLVLKFFDLCEMLSATERNAADRTHPPSADRWSRISAQTGLDKSLSAFARNLDPAFEHIARGVRVTSSTRASKD